MHRQTIADASRRLIITLGSTIVNEALHVGNVADASAMVRRWSCDVAEPIAEASAIQKSSAMQKSIGDGIAEHRRCVGDASAMSFIFEKRRENFNASIHDASRRCQITIVSTSPTLKTSSGTEA